MFTKKIKILLGLGSSLIGVTSIVTPLCCSCSDSSDRAQNDRIYNIDERQYQHIEQQYHAIVEAKIRKEGKDTKTPEEIQKEVNEANERINQQLVSFREQKEKQNATFTEVTDAIIDSASNDFGVSLSRNLGDVNWNVENSKVEQEYANLLRNNLNKEGILTPEEVDQQIKSFHNKFGALSTRLGKEYTDPLRAQNELKAQIATCFEDANNDMALLAATTVNRNFFKDYNFKLKEKTKQGQKIYWDELQKDKETFKVDPNGRENLAFTTWVNDNYECTNVKTKKTWEFNLLAENNNLISNYHIAPIFKGFAKEPLTNTYKIKVDWTFIKNDNYAKAKVDFALAQKVTGHSFVLNNSSKVKKNNFNYIEDAIKAPDTEKKFNEYLLPATLAEERKSIREAYLDKIDFKWAPKEQCKYEKFFCAMKLDEEHPKGILNTEQLADVSLTLALKSDQKFISLKDLLIDTQKTDIKKWTLLNHFVNNCDIQSDSIVTDDAKHIVDNAIFASYKSSTYSKNRKIEGNRWEKIGDFRAEGFPISKEIWESAKNDFDKTKKMVDKMNENLFSQGNKKAIYLGATLGLFLIICIALTIKAFFKNPPHFFICAILTGAVAAASAATAIFAIKPQREWFYKFENVKDSDVFKAIKADIDNDEKKYYHDENTFRNTPWLDISKKISKYENFDESTLVKEMQKEFPDVLNLDKFQSDVINKINTFNCVWVIMVLAAFQAMSVIAILSREDQNAIEAYEYQTRQAANNVTEEVASVRTSGNFDYSFTSSQMGQDVSDFEPSQIDILENVAD